MDVIKAIDALSDEISARAQEIEEARRLPGDLAKKLAVKEKIKALIDDEPPNKPLSDSAVVKLLKAEGIEATLDENVDPIEELKTIDGVDASEVDKFETQSTAAAAEKKPPPPPPKLAVDDDDAISVRSESTTASEGARSRCSPFERTARAAADLRRAVAARRIPDAGGFSSGNPFDTNPFAPAATTTSGGSTRP